MRTVAATPGTVIPIGRQGENEVVTVIFDTAAWPVELGAGSFQLVHKRVNDSTPYPCVITVDDDGNVNWLIKMADVHNVGFGCAQLSFIVDETIAKSMIFTTSTLPSLGGGGDVPEPYQDWVDAVLEAGAHALIGASDSEAWAVGQRDGEDVPETDETWHNNSKYYSEVAAQHAAEDGFMAFYIDQNGDLIYQRTTNVDVSFRLVDGDLYVGVG
jgi:hypothetical protein